MKKDEDFLLTIERDYLHKILSKISLITEIPIEILKSKEKPDEIVIARHLYFYLAFSEKPFKLSFTKIGSLVNRDHATVMYGIKKIKEAIEIRFLPVTTSLEEFYTIKNIYNKYTLIWEYPSLLELLREGKKLQPS